jgi:hypothetical protein
MSNSNGVRRKDVKPKIVTIDVGSDTTVADDQPGPSRRIDETAAVDRTEALLNQYLSGTIGFEDYQRLTAAAAGIANRARVSCCAYRHSHVRVQLASIDDDDTQKLVGDYFQTLSVPTSSSGGGLAGAFNTVYNDNFDDDQDSYVDAAAQLSESDGDYVPSRRERAKHDGPMSGRRILHKSSGSKAKVCARPRSLVFVCRSVRDLAVVVTTLPLHGDNQRRHAMCCTFLVNRRKSLACRAMC